MKDKNKTKEQLFKESENAITEKRLEFLLANCPAVIYTCEFGGNWAGTFISENIKELFGYEASEFIDNPNTWVDGIHPEDRERVFANLDNLMNNDYHCHEYRFCLKDGTYMWVYDELRVVRDQQGNPLECIGYWTDITERKRAGQLSEKYVKRLEKLYEVSMMLSGDPIDIFQNTARVIGELLDVRVVCLSEIRGDELFFISVYVDGEVMTDVGSCPLSITPCATVHKTKDMRVYDHVTKMFPEASFLKMHNAYSYCGFPSLNNAGDVNAITCLLDDKPHDFSEDDKKLLQIFGQRIGLEIERQGNMNKRKEAEEKLEHMAYYDQLTSLPNRTNFISHIGRMLKSTKWKSDYLFAVLFIDLDRFKVVNDSLGHIIGDKLLIEVARRLEECTRSTDRISRDEGNDRLSRFGGDEFALFLHDIKDIISASRVADRIQKVLQKPFNLDGYELFTSASIGIALSVTGYKNAEDILRDADSAMYRAKATGRARAKIFDEEMHVRVTKILQLESDLRTAVEKEQFMVYYQPIVSATDGKITGAEALLRWNHPEQGFISPMDFIPIAEETGLISTIGEWVLRTACAQNKAWQDAGYQHFLMKVNFSSRQFKDENITEVIKKVLRETDMPAQLLDVEITETIAMEKSSIKILNQLTDMGLQTSIDDFGTGYSSLGSLTQFPINTIKIDRTFVKDISIDVNAEAIIKAIIAMAHSLNMEVVAEGVETEEQLAFLQSQKCDKIQGYLFSPPVPEEEFRKLLEKGKNSSPTIQKHSESMV